MIIKLSWLPWLVIAAGVLVLLDDGNWQGIPMIAVGVVWLILRSRKKNTDSTQTGNTSTAENTTASESCPPQLPSEQSPAAVYCSSCGSVNAADAQFCAFCGNKL